MSSICVIFTDLLCVFVVVVAVVFSFLFFSVMAHTRISPRRNMRHEHEQLTLNDCGPFFVSQRLKEREREKMSVLEYQREKKERARAPLILALLLRKRTTVI